MTAEKRPVDAVESVIPNAGDRKMIACGEVVQMVDVVANIDADNAGVGPRQDLGEMAEKIRITILAAEESAKTAVHLAVEVGHLLTGAKSKIKHGKWAGWLAANVPVSHRTANIYMRLAEASRELSTEDWQRVANLPLRDAVNAISNPAVPTRHKPLIQIPRKDRDGLKAKILKSAAALRKSAKMVDFGYGDGRDLKHARTALSEATALLDKLSGLAAEDSK